MSLVDKEILASILFYYHHRQQLVPAYRGRYLLFYQDVMLGDFSSWADAYRQGFQLLQHPRFFVKYCQ